MDLTAESKAILAGPQAPPPLLRSSRRLSRRGWRVLLAAGAAIVVAVAGVLGWHRGSEAGPQYTTVPAARGSVAPAVTSSGTVNPVTTVEVGSNVSGVIQAILCDFNTQVKAGQLCARIDPRPFRTVVAQETAALGIARAQLVKDQANLGYARAVQERSASLFQQGMVSQEAADNADNLYEQARAQLALDQAGVAQHEAQLQAARINLGYTDIVSPVDGTVVSRNVTQGQTVAASFQTPTLFLIATDLTKMQVDTNVSESDIGRIAAGDAAVFTVASFPERRFRGSVEQVRQAPQTVQNVVTYDVVVAVANADLALKPGMTASVRIVSREAGNVLRVPVQALRYRPAAAPATAQGVGDGSARNAGPAAGEDSTQARRAGRVWILRDGVPRRIPVSVGLEDDAYAEIAGGPLREGDAVILSEMAGSHAPPVPTGLGTGRP
jgi:HlyD family secretion protein